MVQRQWFLKMASSDMYIDTVQFSRSNSSHVRTVLTRKQQPKALSLFYLILLGVSALVAYATQVVRFVTGTQGRAKAGCDVSHRIVTSSRL